MSNKTISEMLQEELTMYKERVYGALEFIESRKEHMIPEHYDDLHYILAESKFGEW